MRRLKNWHCDLFGAWTFGLWTFTTASAAPLSVSLIEPPPAESGYFAMGTPRSPSGAELTVDSRSLRLDGQPWVPAMGEFHYTRYPATEWREELLKMRAGGIDIVATYVFWIHHEEIEGRWDWSGSRDLRRFVQTAHDVGLKVVVRCGPWCHGEVRNGGLPEWVVTRKTWKPRSTDPQFLAATRQLYTQIAQQLKGELWKDGGPVIGIQVDNEYRGPAAYLLALKSIARGVGLDVPMYTRTGWPALTTPMPLGEILPLYGVYAEGFWDRELTSMPGRYWAGFHFSALRSDAAIATEMLGNREAKDDPDAAKYPYLTCEIGGGMMNSYHRRILVDPRDIEATTLIKIAGGSTLPGYYMFHGGTNPDGRQTTLMESQASLTTNYNDLPVKTYDFQAPLGEFGEVRPQYHLLRRLHLFLGDYGSDLAGMVIALPDARPAGRDDVTTPRWAVRSDGRRGFVFINNHERGRTLPPKTAVQFAVRLARGGTLTFPANPVTIGSDVVAWWPFNLDVGGLTLTAATAQPFTHIIDDHGVRTIVFAATPGVAPEFQFPCSEVVQLRVNGQLSRDRDVVRVWQVPTGREIALRLLTKSGQTVQFIVLDEADSLALWKGTFAGRSRLILTRANVVFDRGELRLTPTAEGRQSVGVFPGVKRFAVGSALGATMDGVFQQFALPEGVTTTEVAVEALRPAGELRQIHPGVAKVATAPSDADFAQAAVWRIQVPADVDFERRPLLRIDYVGDVARVLVGGRMVTDDFYNGGPRDVGLWRFANELARGALEFAVLPLQKDAPIFLPGSAKPEFGDRRAIAAVRGATLRQTTTFVVTGTAE